MCATFWHSLCQSSAARLLQILVHEHWVAADGMASTMQAQRRSHSRYCKILMKCLIYTCFIKIKALGAALRCGTWQC